MHWLLYVMLVPALLLLLLFSFYPLLGIVIAFLDYKPTRGFGGSEFVGLKNFVEIFTMREAWPLFRNTIVIAVGKMFFGTIASLLFALMVHEVVSKLFKRVVQTVTTLPHFLSWVIIGGVMVQVMASAGPINNIIVSIFGGKPLKFLGDPSVFTWTVILSETWKEFGFGAVIYLAALTGINPELYEAAAVDGSGRWTRLRHITLPSIASIIVLLLCLNLGNVLNAGFEQLLILSNPIVYSTGDIIDTWVYRRGLVQSEYSLSTALGLVKSTVGFILI
ncbi:MAG: ABC transporter permease subunit, partial [Chloroflexi bacterium]|nr:ABC transporter permease subunit [Chloroflexota bacterium]